MPDARKAPRVSVVIPTRLTRPETSETITSVLGQDFNDFEIIVVSDRDCDSPPQQVDIEKYRDPRMRVLDRQALRPDQRGAAVCRNLGTEHARGEFVLFLDDDDLLAPHCLGRRIATLEQSPDTSFSIADCRLFEGRPTECDKLWGAAHAAMDDPLSHFIAGRCVWQTSAALWRKCALNKLGPWDEDLVALQEYEFYVRALCAGMRFVVLDDPDYFYRKVRPDSITALENQKAGYRSGARPVSFVRAWEAVTKANLWTPARRNAAWTVAVQCAAKTLLFGGTRQKALAPVRAARGHGCVSALKSLEAEVALRLWMRIGGRIPALWYLNLRGLTER